MLPENINSILIITLSNIGDVILTTPVIDILKKQFPRAKMDIVCTERSVDLFKNDPAFGHVFTYHKFSSWRDKIKFIFQLRKQKYDLTADLRNTLIPYFLNTPYRTSSFENKKQILHMKDKHLKKLDRFGLDTKQACFHIYISEEDERLMDNLLKETAISSEKLIAVSPGARSEIKRWGKVSFIEVIKAILGDLKDKAVLIGDRGDLKLSEEIMSALVENGRDRSLLNLTGKTTLPQLACLLKRCALLITNDSATLHMASAVNTKTLAIFGPTSPRKYGPLADGSAVVQKNLPCVPCEVAQCRFRHECMKEISPREILNKIREMV